MFNAGRDVYRLFVEASTESLWRVRPDRCMRREYIGNFKANLTVTGYRNADTRYRFRSMNTTSV